jgi:hypothetical protein
MPLAFRHVEYVLAFVFIYSFSSLSNLFSISPPQFPIVPSPNFSFLPHRAPSWYHYTPCTLSSCCVAAPQRRQHSFPSFPHPSPPHCLSHVIAPPMAISPLRSLPWFILVDNGEAGSLSPSPILPSSFSQQHHRRDALLRSSPFYRVLLLGLSKAHGHRSHHHIMSFVRHHVPSTPIRLPDKDGSGMMMPLGWR